MFKLADSRIKKLADEVEYFYSRSSGPGGQKVNKTETRVELHWFLDTSQSFSLEQKVLLENKLRNRLSKEGKVIFYSDQFRTRPANQKACFENFVEALERALTVPKKRKKTKPTKASKEKRLKNKKFHSDKKKMRQKID